MADARPRIAPLILLATAVVYLPLLRADFVWDDGVLVVRNQLTGTLANLPRLFVTSLWQSTPVSTPHPAYYRPLVLVDLALDRALFGLTPAFYHLESIVWHLAAVGLVYALLRRLDFGPLAAGVGTTVFALHPAQVEAVAFISARNDPMAAVLLLAGLLVLLRERGSLLGGGLLVMGATLCKESAVLAPLLVGAVWLARHGRLGGPGPYVVACAAVAIDIVLRLSVGVHLPKGASVGRLMALAPQALAFEARTILWPVGLVPGLNLAYRPPIPWALLAVGIGVAVLLVARGGRRAAAGLGFAALAWAPAMAAIANVGLVADRYLYLPMAGIGIAVAAAIEGASQSRWRKPLPPRIVTALLLLATVAGGVGVSRLLPTWRDDESLWTTALSRHPNPYVYDGYAKLLEDHGDLAGAATWYERATVPPAPSAHACYNVARIHLKRGDPAAAARAGQAALGAGCSPTPELVAPTAVGLAATGRWEAAAELARRVDHDPTGQAIVVRVAAAARRGDLGPLHQAQASGKGDPVALAKQVAWLLEQGGALEAAAQVRAAE